MQLHSFDAQDFFSNNPTPDPTTINSVAREMLKVVPTKYACEICTTDAGHPTVVNGDEEWKQHIRSRWHRKNAARRKKEANGDEAGKRKRDRGATVTTGSTEMVATSDGQGLGIGCERED
ncbi:hypothetical protein BC938DRAFT_482428 [Jimgerdemannia flammicorona]|uniref:Uncharacterized protein n=1 Tax=Jimgerdemannia flammicorona TaxID=994334 RepID=A0A433QE78_9FUNG|nr:hypothetical protein BC938DRAFT_482428 [Jimgerdemannia flammicorona]